jgi:ribulose-phosphate 3-epimerase
MRLMASTVKIAPSILAADFARLAEAIKSAEAAGADYIHVDVMDGHFVPNISVGPPVVRAVRRVTQLPLDVHLMISDPMRYVPAFAEAGADGLTVHVEATPHLHRVLHQIRDLDVRPGVSLNPATPVAAISEILNDVDLVLVMTVDPGFGGQPFNERSLDKITRVQEMLESARSEAELEVDGGIDPRTAEQVVAAGATVLVAGTAVFGAPEGVRTGIAAIRAAARRGQRLVLEGGQKKPPIVGSCYRVELFPAGRGVNETCSTSAGSEYRDASGAPDH